MTALAAVACLVGLLIVAAVAWRRSRLDHSDLDEVALAAEYDRQRGYDRPREERAGPPVFAATVADFPGVVFTPTRPRFNEFLNRALQNPEVADAYYAARRRRDAPCPTCGATGTDPCRTLTTGRATSGHRGRA